jgi:hypothetical protein
LYPGFIARALIKKYENKKVKQIMLKSENNLKEYFKIVPLLFLVLYYCFLSNNQNISFVLKVIILSVMILLSLFILNKNITSKKHFKSSIIITILSTIAIIIAIFTFKMVVIHYS